MDPVSTAIASSFLNGPLVRAAARAAASAAGTGRAQNWYPISELGWFTGHIREGITVTRRLDPQRNGHGRS